MVRGSKPVFENHVRKLAFLSNDSFAQLYISSCHVPIITFRISIFLKDKCKWAIHLQPKRAEFFVKRG